MKNVTFIGGPLHNQDRTIEAGRTWYAETLVIEPKGFASPDNPVKVEQCCYEETAPGSLIFRYTETHRISPCPSAS